MTGPADALPTLYRFADLTLDTARRSVTRAGQPIELKALDFDLLRFLVESAPSIVNLDVLAEKVWGRHFVSPENVAQRVMLLRQSLSDDANRPRYIETIRNKGYRLVPVVERVRADAPAAPRRWPIATAAVLALAIAVSAIVSYWVTRTAVPPLDATLRPEVSAAERQRVERLSTGDPRARDLYLVAKARRPLSPEVLLAVAEVEEALALDADFKEAWLLDAQLRNFAQFVDPGRGDEHRARGYEAARRAVELDGAYGQAHATLGWSLLMKQDWAGAEEAFRTARQLNVPTAELGAYASLQLGSGRFNELAREIYEAARAADPQNELYHRMAALLHETRGEWARASAVYASALQLFANDRRATFNLQNQRMHWLVGREALAEAREVPIEDDLSAAMLASLDSPQRALAALRMELASGGNAVRRRDIGLWAAHFGDPVLAFNAFRSAIDEQAAQLEYVWFPQAAAMRDLPEFKAYLGEIGLVDYWREYGWPSICRPLEGTHDFDCD